MSEFGKNRPNSVVVTCATGTEALLLDEIQSLGGESWIKSSGAVTGQCDLATAYRICLWSRVGSRVLWQVAEVPATDPDALYRAAAEIPWDDYFSSDKRI
ncbi:MAG: hypothetical protein R3208_17485, partial [Ketobacteraceae bacterium]|nr:hypothetical protein [Ketobacteraceae bacterium]